MCALTFNALNGQTSQNDQNVSIPWPEVLVVPYKNKYTKQVVAPKIVESSFYVFTLHWW